MLTLSGSNFGPTGTSPTTSIDATQCTTSIWMSTTSIECMLPAGMGAQAAIVASISSSASLIGTLRRSFTYDCELAAASFVTSVVRVAVRSGLGVRSMGVVQLRR